jgi:hypothetical protein
MIWDVHPGSIRILIFPHPGSGSRIQSLKGTGSQHCFFVLFFVYFAVIFP